MFCSKCGKTIDDNATFCAFCGAAVEQNANTVTNGAPQGIPQQSAPQYGAPQNNAPQYGAPQNNAPQYGAPQNNVPQYGAPMGSGVSINLAPNMVALINKILRGSLILLSVMMLVGSIGTLATIGTANSGKSSDMLGVINAMIAFVNLARIPAIISFGLALGGAIFTYLTKQRSLFSYISCGVGLIMFIFNFLLIKFSSLMAMITAKGTGAATVGAIFLLISAVLMIACSVIILMNKEDIIKFKPNF